MLCFISVIRVAFSISEKRFSQSIREGLWWEVFESLTGLLEIWRVMHFVGLSLSLSGVSSKKKKEPDWGNLGKWGQHDVWFGYSYWGFPMFRLLGTGVSLGRT